MKNDYYHGPRVWSKIKSQEFNPLVFVIYLAIAVITGFVIMFKGIGSSIRIIERRKYK